MVSAGGSDKGPAPEEPGRCSLGNTGRATPGTTHTPAAAARLQKAPAGPPCGPHGVLEELGGDKDGRDQQALHETRIKTRTKTRIMTRGLG